MIDRIDLVRTVAGEWDSILLPLFDRYMRADSAEKARLSRVLAADFRQMTCECPPAVVDFYKTLFATRSHAYALKN